MRTTATARNANTLIWDTTTDDGSWETLAEGADIEPAIVEALPSQFVATSSRSVDRTSDGGAHSETASTSTASPRDTATNPLQSDRSGVASPTS